MGLVLGVAGNAEKTLTGDAVVGQSGFEFVVVAQRQFVAIEDVNIVDHEPDYFYQSMEFFAIIH